VYTKRHVRNKYDPLVDEVELVQINPNHGVIRYPNGRESTVFIRDLAPIGSESGLNKLVDPGDTETNHANIAKLSVPVNPIPHSP